MANKKLLIEKTLLLGLLLTSIFGFWYFESSLILRSMVILMSVLGLGLSFFRHSEKPQLASQREFLILLILFLGLFGLYNAAYGLAIPLYLIMIATLVLVWILFYTLLILDRLDTLIEKPVFLVLTAAIGLIVLEIFISLSYWPIDPKAKSLIIVVIFYLVTSLIYLYMHNVLRLKRIVGYLIICGLILAVLILLIWFGFFK